ncbi:MAG: hypothetical protein PGN26_08490 [Xylophilus ampelinus]
MPACLLVLSLVLLTLWSGVAARAQHSGTVVPIVQAAPAPTVAPQGGPALSAQPTQTDDCLAQSLAELATDRLTTDQAPAGVARFDPGSAAGSRPPQTELRHAAPHCPEGLLRPPACA